MKQVPSDDQHEVKAIRPSTPANRKMNRFSTSWPAGTPAPSTMRNPLRISPGRALRLTGAIAISTAVGIGVLAGTATASVRPAAGHATYKNCRIMLAPVQPHQSASRVISRTCSDGQATGDAPRRASPSTTYSVITGYQYTNYGGHWIDWYGSKPCSSSVSYAIPDARPSHNDSTNWGISSWKAHSSCYHTTLYYSLDYGGISYTYGQGVWEAAQIGSPFNDHVWSIWTRYK